MPELHDRIRRTARETETAFLRSVVLVSAVACVVTAILVEATSDADRQFWIALSGGAICGGLYFASRRSLDTAAIARLYLGVALVYVTIANASIGGEALFSIAFAWFLVIPVLATMFFGTRAGVLWVAAVVAVCGGFLALDRLGVVFDREPATATVQFGTVVAPAVFLLAVVAFFHRHRVTAERALASAFTDLAAAHDEIDDARRRAEDASEAKSRFLANMSHEIRTPMNGVVGLTQVLAAGDLEPEQRELVAAIGRSGDALLAVINDILDLSKIESSSLEIERMPVDVRSCVEEALDVVALAAATKGIELASTVAADVSTLVVSDVTRLRQALVNLVGNAVKFTDEGQVNVRVTTTSDAQGQRLLFEVVDTGRGIAEAALERIFEPFGQQDSSTTRTHGGSGLGLAITRELVGLMGGSLQVESVEGVGSTFRFDVLARPLDKRAEGAPADVLEALEGRSVAVVAPNAMTRSAVAAQLAAWGIATSEAADLVPVRLEIQRGDCGLVLVDLDTRDGAAFALGRLMAEGDGVPLVALGPVGRTLRADDRRLFAALVTKPVRRDALEDAVRHALIDQYVEAPADPASEPSGPAPGLSVLLAEDNDVNRMVALKMLERLGVAADVAEDGVQAVKAATTASYDVVLMDIQMPVLDGVGAASQISDLMGEDRPWIVAMTANALVGDRETYLASGMDDYIAKPVALEELRRALDAVPMEVAKRAAPDR